MTRGDAAAQSPNIAQCARATGRFLGSRITPHLKKVGAPEPQILSYLGSPCSKQLLNLAWWPTIMRWRISVIDPIPNEVDGAPHHQNFWNVSDSSAKITVCRVTKLDMLIYQGQTINKQGSLHPNPHFFTCTISIMTARQYTIFLRMINHIHVLPPLLLGLCWQRAGPASSYCYDDQLTESSWHTTSMACS